MAPKQVTDILVRLGIEGFEGLEKIKSSFRELGKVSNLTGDQIQDVRAQILDFAKEAGNTQRVNKGLEEAFRGLLGEAERGSDVWKQLNADLSKLRQESRLTDREIAALRDVIVKETQAHNQSSSSIREHIKSLQELRSQASLNGKIHQELGADIQKLTTTLNSGSQANREHYKSLGQILAVKPDKVLKQWENYTRILQEGTASAEKLEVAQRRLNQLSGAPRILERRRIAESAAITQDPEYLRRFGFAGASLPELPNTNAGYAQQIKELNQDLANLNRTSVEYLQTQMQLAGVQRQATEVTRGFAQALVMGLRTKTVENSTRNLQEAITALRAEMQQLDTSTAEGSRVYAENANNVRELEGQLKKLGDSYRHVADMATQAATAEQNAANARTRGNYFNRAAVRQQEQAFIELRQRIQQGVAGTPLLLPAAGQTTAAGTGLAMSGGARPFISEEQRTRFFQPGELGSVIPRSFGPEATPEQLERNRRSVIAQSEAYSGLGRAVDRSRRPLREIFADISKTQQASNGSVNSLQAQIAVWTELRNALNSSAPAFATATGNIQRLTRQQDALAGRGRISPAQAVQTAGAVISGGIFGGPEGFAGGLLGAGAGAAIPGLGIVGGAFAGSAAGAQIGMFRQQIAGTADYAAQIGKLQIALRGILGNQDDYNKAIAAAASVTRDLNIPQADATRGLTRLSAAVLGAGGSINDSAFAFRAMSEAIKATGGNAEQVDGALLALTQVFSKGKVSAEELNQIAERLPGTFTLFAEATGRTGPELQKALEQGQVGLDDLMKFITLVGGKYDETALKIAKSSEDAGARLRVAFDDMRLNVGKALQPLGAQLQEVFTGFLVSVTPALVAIAKAIPSLVEGFRKAYQQGGILKGVIDGLVGSLIAFATIQVFGAFIAGAKAAITVTGALVKALKALTAANLIAGAAGFLKSKPGLIAALVAGLGVGIDAAFNQGKIVKGITSGITGAIDQAFSGLGAMIPEIPALSLSGGKTDFPDPSGKNSDRDRKQQDRDRKDLFNELLNQLNAQNEVLAKQGRLNESVSKTEIVRAAAALSAAEQILRNEQAQLDLRLKFGEISKKVYDDQQKAIRLEAEIVRQEFAKTVKKLQEEAKGLVIKYTGAGGIAAPEETPFQRARREIAQGIQEDRARAAQIGGVEGERAGAALAGLDVRQIATRQILGAEVSGLEKEIRDLQQAGKELSTLDQLKQKYLQDWDSLDPILRNQLELLAAQKDAIVKQTEAARNMKQLYADIGMSIKDGVVSAIQGAIDGTKTLQEVASDLLRSIANRLLDVAINLALFGAMSGTGKGGGLLGFLFKNAMGNAYAKNGIVPFAYGGVVDRPTLFPFAKGIGLMGEAGPEAILPLRRGRDGKLGVTSSGSGNVVVNVSVDASGSSVQGDDQQANQLGRVVAIAVQQEMIKQKRPGGLLA
jgi:tape measure domain-containing protein